MRFISLIQQAAGSALDAVLSLFFVSDSTGAYRFIFRRWPALRSRMPGDLEFRRTEFLSVLASSLQEPVYRWTGTRGGSRFLGDEVRDPYRAVLLQRRGNAEFLAVMWHLGGRKFWFSEQFVEFVGGPKRGDLLDRSRRRLDEALAKWDAGAGPVIYCPHFGWYDADSRRYETDPPAADPAQLDTLDDPLRSVYEEQWDTFDSN